MGSEYGVTGRVGGGEGDSGEGVLLAPVSGEYPKRGGAAGALATVSGHVAGERETHP